MGAVSPCAKMWLAPGQQRRGRPKASQVFLSKCTRIISSRPAAEG